MVSDMDVRTAIRNGDADALRHLLAQEPAQANALIFWGNNDCLRTHPLHYISDVLFNRVLQKGNELPLIDALLEAGAIVDFRKAEGQGTRCKAHRIPFRKGIVRIDGTQHI
jgi:hypothetical protein